MSPPIDEYILVDGGDFYKLSNSIKVYNCEFIDSLNHSMFKEHAGDLTAYMKVVNKQKSWCKTIADSHGVVFKLNDPLTACVLLAEFLFEMDKVLYDFDSSFIDVFDFCFDINEENSQIPLNEKICEEIKSMPNGEQDKIKEYIVSYYLDYEYELVVVGRWEPIITNDYSLAKIYQILANQVNRSAAQLLYTMRHLTKNNAFALGNYLIAWYQDYYKTDDIIEYRNRKNQKYIKSKKSISARKMGEYIGDVIKSDYLSDFRDALSYYYFEPDTLQIARCKFKYGEHDFLFRTTLQGTRKDDIAWTKDEALEMAIIDYYFLNQNGEVDVYNVAGFVMMNISHYSKMNVMRVFRVLSLYGRIVTDLAQIRELTNKTPPVESSEDMALYELLNSKKANTAWKEALKAKLLTKDGNVYKWIGNKRDFACFVHNANKFLYSPCLFKETRINWKVYCHFFGQSIDDIHYFTTQNSTLYATGSKVTLKMRKIAQIFKYIKY